MAKIQLKTLKFPGLEDTYVMPEISISDPNNDGNVEVIFGVAPSVTLISFYIDGNTYDSSVTKTYQAEEGMTWVEWVNSEYNTTGFKAYGDMIHPASGSGMLYDETGSPMFDATTRKIIADCTYAIGM